MGDTNGCIFIMINPSFEEWIQNGHAKDVWQRLVALNQRAEMRFAFRVLN